MNRLKLTGYTQVGYYQLSDYIIPDNVMLWRIVGMFVGFVSVSSTEIPIWVDDIYYEDY